MTWEPCTEWDADKLMKSNSLMRRTKSMKHLLNPKQREFYSLWEDGVHNHIGLYCARKSGKSLTALAMAYEFCWNNPGKIVRYICPELKQAREVVLPIADELKMFVPEDMRPEVKKADLKLVFPNGATICLGGAKKDNADSNRGPICHLLIRDEIASWASGEDYKYINKGVLYPQLTTTRGKIIDLTTPPANIAHDWIRGDFEKLSAKNALVCFDIDDNPLLDADQIEEIIERYGGRDDPEFQREYKLALISNQNIRVIPEWPLKHDEQSEFVFSGTPQRDGHEDKLIRELYGYMAADLGVVDYTFILSSLYSPVDNCLFVTAESYERGGGFQNFKNSYTELYQKILADSEIGWEPSSVIDCFEQARMALRKDFNLSFKRPTKRKLEDNVGYLRALIKAGKIKISEDCPMLRAQLRLGTWKNIEATNKDFSRTAELGHLDGIATLVYLARSIPWGRSPGIYTAQNMNLTGRR